MAFGQALDLVNNMEDSVLMQLTLSSISIVTGLRELKPLEDIKKPLKNNTSCGFMSGKNTERILLIRSYIFLDRKASLPTLVKEIMFYRLNISKILSIFSSTLKQPTYLEIQRRSKS